MRRPGFAAISGCALIALAGCSRTTPPPQTASPSNATNSTGLVTTGAIDTLSSEQLRGRHAGDVAEMLQGRVAGLQVIRLGNGDISLRIRGDDSILSNGEPLVILDGAPVASQSMSDVLRGLNPREIASIDVLKDVASTAPYGIKGAHGVIIITMKHER
jgi:TonB-dependent starch-binding outer membrane protein SusC